MFHKEWQVCLTYLTQRWIWFMGLVSASFVFGGTVAALDADSPESLDPSFFASSLAVPILIGGAFLVSVAKWQFANPRARLIPGYAKPHIFVLGMILVVALVFNPLIFAYALGISPWGPLAYTLIQGGGYLWAVGAFRGWLILPLMALFFSAFSEPGVLFWFLDQQPVLVIHGLLITFSSATVVGWLWRLVHLDEEMLDYQVTPLAGWSRPSRLESAEARKLVGRHAAKRGMASWLSDAWHDRLPQAAATPNQRKRLLRYGFNRLSPRIQSAWFAILLIALTSATTIFAFRDRNPATYGMLLVFALSGPGAIVLLHLRQRQGRMPQELLVPLSREEFFAGLWQALAWEMLLIWLALTVSLAGLTGLGFLKVPELTIQSAAGFAVFSAAMLLPTFGVALRLARVRSAIVLGVGGYAVLGAQVAWLSLWWNSPPLIGCLVMVFTVVFGVVLINWSRQQWLEVELG